MVIEIALARQTWRFWDLNKHLTEDECYRHGIHKPSKPADYPGEGWTPLVLGRDNEGD